jgi:hypothetical protein
MAEVCRTLCTARVADAALSAQTLALSIKTLFRQLREDATMCATKKKASGTDLKVGMIMELSLDEFRRSKGKITTGPGDSPAMVESAIQAVGALLDTPTGHLFRLGLHRQPSLIARELRMVVVGHSAAEDTHDSYGDIKNDFSIADRKRAIEALKFD